MIEPATALSAAGTGPRAGDAVRLNGVAQDSIAAASRALGPLDLDVRDGEFVSLLGPSGCGKSTALRIIAGLSEPTAGTVEWPAAGGAAGTSRIGFVFQEPTLMPWASVSRQRGAAAEARAARRAPTAAERVEAALARVGLADFAAPIRANCPAA